MLVGRFLEKYDRAIGSKHRRRLNESVGTLNADDMSFEEQLEFIWFIFGQSLPSEMGMEPEEIDEYYKENPDELKDEVEYNIVAFERDGELDEFLSQWEKYKSNGYRY